MEQIKVKAQRHPVPLHFTVKKTVTAQLKFHQRGETGKAVHSDNSWDL